MSVRSGKERGIDFCVFMENHPLNHEKTATAPDGSTITAIKSRKKIQSFKIGRVALKPDPTAICEIDGFVNSDRSGIRAICRSCLRKVKAERVHIPTEE